MYGKNKKLGEKSCENSQKEGKMDNITEKRTAKVTLEYMQDEQLQTLLYYLQPIVVSHKETVGETCKKADIVVQI